MTEADQRPLVDALHDGRGFPHSIQSVWLFETHISWVLLAGRHAYKIKKAVHPGFLDFRTLASRKYYCEEEIRLNRRLAPEIYLGVVPIGGTCRAPLIGKLPAIEYAVKMRRFDPAKTLDNLAEKRKLQPRHIDILAEKIAAFHQGLPPADPHHGSGANLLEVAQASFIELKKHSHEDLGPLQEAVKLEHEKSMPHFGKRWQAGMVRECHGDLHLGNIALIRNEPVPFDGIEFDENLRWIDVANEIAFPVMDLFFHDRPDLAWRFHNRYLEITGDFGGMQVFRFYLACRAVVRAMVDAMRGQHHSVRRHLDLAARSLAPPCPFLIITHGLPGSGKTTFAGEALERLGAVRLRSDIERKRMAGLDPQARSGAGIAQGIYAPAYSESVYSRLLELASLLLSCGWPVIVDAAFLEKKERERFAQLASDSSIPYAIAMTEASRRTLAARIQSRKNDASEADLAVLEAKERDLVPLDETELNHAAHFTEDAAQWDRLCTLIGRRAPASLPC